MSEKPKHLSSFLITLSALTIIESIILACVFLENRTLLLMAFFFLTIPFFLLWLFAIGIVINCIKMRNIWERRLVAWVASLVLLIPVSLIINKWYMDYNYSSAIIELPDGDALTVTSDKVIFGKCDDSENPQKDYIDLRCECLNYSITLTQNDTLYIWTENDSLPATTHELKYPVGKIYTGDDRDEYTIAVIKKMKWMFEYNFMYDGLFTGGTQTLITRIGDSDSLHEKSWSINSSVYVGKRDYPHERTTTLKEYFKYSIPVDSLFD